MPRKSAHSNHKGAHRRQALLQQQQHVPHQHSSSSSRDKEHNSNNNKGRDHKARVMWAAPAPAAASRASRGERKEVYWVPPGDSGSARLPQLRNQQPSQQQQRQAQAEHGHLPAAARALTLLRLPTRLRPPIPSRLPTRSLLGRARTRLPRARWELQQGRGRGGACSGMRRM